MVTLASTQERTWALLLTTSPSARAACASGRSRPQPSPRRSSSSSQCSTSGIWRAPWRSRPTSCASRTQSQRKTRGRRRLTVTRGCRVTRTQISRLRVSVFITHHPRGRTLTHAIPPITLRNPELVEPSIVPPMRLPMGSRRWRRCGGRLTTHGVLGWGHPTGNFGVVPRGPVCEPTPHALARRPPIRQTHSR